MPNLPNREARIAQLVRRGILPTLAESIVNECERAGQRLLTTAEAEAQADVTAADVEQARLWWRFTPDVPTDWRRILEARVVGDA